MTRLLIPPSTKKYKPMLGALLYIIPFVLGLIYWMAFYPGVMTFDSVYQWKQLSTFLFTDWHPAINTILMWALTRTWYSPAILSLFQVMIACLVFGYGLNNIRKASQLPGYVFIILSVLISGNPLVGVMVVTIWKDILYSLMVLLLTIFVFNLLISDGEWILKPVHVIALGFSLAFIWLFRFNGFPISIATLIVIAIIYKKYIKQIAIASLIAAIIILFVLGPLYAWFNVNRGTRQSYGVSLVHPIVAYVNSKTDLGHLSADEIQYLNQIFPLSQSWPYSCYDATVFIYQVDNFPGVTRDTSKIVRIFIKLAVRDPMIAIKHYLCLSSFVWQPNQPENVYLETIVLKRFDFAQAPDWKIYQHQINQDSKLPAIREIVTRLVVAEQNKDVNKIVWRPAIYMYVFLGSLILITIRNRSKKWLLLSLPMIAQSIVIMFTAQLQALRYQFPVYLISMLFTIPIFMLGFRKSVSNPQVSQIQ